MNFIEHLIYFFCFPDATKFQFLSVKASKKISSILFVFLADSRVKQWQWGSKVWVSHDAKALECIPRSTTSQPLLHIDTRLTAGSWRGLGKASRVVVLMSKAHLSASPGPVDLNWHEDRRGGEIKKQVLAATTRYGSIAHHHSGRMCAGMCKTARLVWKLWQSEEVHWTGYYIS